jgi:hypothetical protein
MEINHPFFKTTPKANIYGTGAARINVNSPFGNVYNLLQFAEGIMMKLKYTDEKQLAIQDEMMNGSYEHLLETFAKYFGRVFQLYYSDNYEMHLVEGDWGYEDEDEDEE